MRKDANDKKTKTVIKVEAILYHQDKSTLFSIRLAGSVKDLPISNRDGEGSGRSPERCRVMAFTGHVHGVHKKRAILKANGACNHE